MSASQQIQTPEGLGTVDEKGRLVIELDDGGLLIKTDWKPKQAANDGESRKHTGNLAEGMSEYKLSEIGEDILRGIQSDELSRREWLEGLTEAVEMLGLRVKKPGASSDDSAAPLEGMSTFDHPILLQSTLRFQADFDTEMLPADGPVKVRNDATAPPSDAQPGLGHNGGPSMDLPDQTEDDLAQDLEVDMNHYLTHTATEYYPDTKRMAFRLGLYGGAIKKVYDCPLRLRPVSESIQIDDLIVDHSATDIQSAALTGRVTHRIKMQNSMVRRMIKAKVFRDVRDDLVQPSPDNNMLDEAENRAQGITSFSLLPTDHPHIIYEVSTGLDPADVDDGDSDGIYRPYKVTIEKDSRLVLAIRRNWREDDALMMPRREYVKFSYVEGLGFYPIGLIHILGNVVKTLTAAYRLIVDAGMFANFPGFLYSDELGHQLTNQFRVAPGTGVPIQTHGKPIDSMIANIPYREVGATFLQFVEHLEEVGKALGGEVAAPLQEGSSTMPVGTMLAAIEQAVKPLKGVFKGLHRSQAEEFQLLRERFMENPSALWRYNERPSRDWQEEEFVQALKNCNLVPQADPNTSSQLQRVAIAGAVEQLAEKAPMAHNIIPVLKFLHRMLLVPDGGEGLLKTEQEFDAAQQAAAQAQQKPGGPAAQDPALTQAKVQLTQAQIGKVQAEIQNEGADLQDKAADRQQKAASQVVESQDRAADRASHLQIAEMNATVARQKVGSDLAQAGAEDHADSMESERQRSHDAGLATQTQQHQAGMAAQDHQHQAGLAAQQAVNTAAEGGAQRQHETGMAERQAMNSAADGGAQREHEEKMAKAKPAAKKKGSK